MGYRDDFYVPKNIIGYSGQVHAFPTVYFQQGSEFGHITQKHDISQNVGRGDVGDDPKYWIGNESYRGSLRLVEKSGDQIWHVSRSTLKKIEEVPFEDQMVLAQAIYQNTNQKYINDYSDAIFVDMRNAKIAKALMHRELLAR